MKKRFLVLVLSAVWVMSCGSTPQASVVEEQVPIVEEQEVNDRSVANASDVTVTAITGNEWKLIAVRINNRDTGFNRNVLVREGFDQFFTVTFNADTVSGTGAPNHYSAPCTLNNQRINIMMMRSTMMAALFQPENLTEHEFFTYMQNAFEWRLVNNNLELRSKTAAGREVLLVFSP